MPTAGCYVSFATNANTVVDSFWRDTTTSASLTSGYATNLRVWESWTSTGVTGYANGQLPGHAVNFQPVYTEKQLWEMRRAELVRRNRQRAADLRWRMADRTADELLRSVLTAEQREEYDRLSRFHVVADGKTYRIRRGRAGNIDLIEDDRIVERWCVHPRALVPDADTVLSQKLMIESGRAAELRRIANVTPMRRAA